MRFRGSLRPIRWLGLLRRLMPLAAMAGALAVVGAAVAVPAAAAPGGRSAAGHASASSRATVGPFAYVGGTAEVTVIDTSDNTVVTKISLSSETHAWGVAASPDGRHVYAADTGSNRVYVIDTSDNEVAATVNVGSSPGDSPGFFRIQPR